MDYLHFIERICAPHQAHNITGVRVVSLVDETLNADAAQLMVVNHPERNDRLFSPQYVWIGYVSELPDDPARAPHDCVCIADIPLPAAYETGDLPVNLVMFAFQPVFDAPPLALLFNCVSFILADDTRYYHGFETIKRAEQNGASLQELVEAMEAHFYNPVVVIDENRTVLATGRNCLFRTQEMRDMVAAGQIDADYMELIRRLDVYEALKTQYAKHAQVEAWNIGKFIVVPIVVKGLVAAKLIMQNQYTGFLLSTIRLLEPLCERISDMILRQMETWHDRSLLHNTLFNTLLRAEPDQEAELRQQIDSLGWREEQGMRLAVCAADTAALDLDDRFQRVRTAVTTCRWTVRGDILLLLLYPDSEDITPLLEREGLRAGVSWPFRNLMAMRYAWQQAEYAFQHGTGTLTHYSTLFSVHIHTLPPQEMRRHLHPAVIELAAYDQSHEGNLLETLERYLSGPDQPSDVAAGLHIHRSTLFYRLGRIRELVDISWETGEERMNLLLTLRLLRAVQPL